MEIKPFKLVPICKPVIWGGTRLAREYGKKAPESDFGKDVIGETWELVVHGEDQSTVLNGPYAGQPLCNVPGCENMPVLIKYIDAGTPLSVQVHPAKTEMWYVVEADPGASLVYGLKGDYNEADFRKACDENRVCELLNYTDVKPGDVYFIPSGLVHALGGGILVAEIQQNSTETYRVYDYGRLHNGKPRELHLEQALRVIRDYTPDELEKLRFSENISAPEGFELIASCEFFSVILFDGAKDACFDARGRHAAVMCLSGCGYAAGIQLKKGETLFVPADSGKIQLSGDMKALVSF